MLLNIIIYYFDAILMYGLISFFQSSTSNFNVLINIVINIKIVYSFTDIDSTNMNV